MGVFVYLVYCDVLFGKEKWLYLILRNIEEVWILCNNIFGILFYLLFIYTVFNSF